MGIVVLSASAEMPKIHVWDAMQVIRDPYSPCAGSWQGHDHRDGVWCRRSTCRTARSTDYRSPPEAQLSAGLPMSEHHRIDAALECRDATGSPGRLVGVVLPVGRVAGDRPEIFIGSGVTIPSGGLALLPEHRSSTIVMHFDPIRGADGTLTIDHPLPDSPEGRAMAASVRSGRTPGLSVEFHSLDSKHVQGVREVRHSLITAVATVPNQSYNQSRAEVRSKRRRFWL